MGLPSIACYLLSCAYAFMTPVGPEDKHYYYSHRYKQNPASYDITKLHFPSSSILAKASGQLLFNLLPDQHGLGQDISRHISTIFCFSTPARRARLVTIARAWRKAAGQPPVLPSLKNTSLYSSPVLSVRYNRPQPVLV